jgi:tetratricopeptide (TPR) repeat protein
MRHLVRHISIVLTFSIITLAPAISIAQQTQLLQAEPSEVAMQALGLAKHYYSQGNFEKAAELFMEAYQIDARVEFMFNAARAYQRAIKLHKAKVLFTRCVKAKNAPAVVIEKAKIYLREIENMEKALSQAKEDGQHEAHSSREGLQEAYAIADMKQEPTKNSPQKWKGNLGAPSLALGAVSGTAGLYLLLNAYELSSSADRDADAEKINYNEYDRQKTKAEKYNMIGWGAVGLGAITAGFGIWCLATQPNNVAVVPTPQGVSVAVRF